jgi:hypothetical protein
LVADFTYIKYQALYEKLLDKVFDHIYLTLSLPVE